MHRKDSVRAPASILKEFAVSVFLQYPQAFTNQIRLNIE